MAKMGQKHTVMMKELPRRQLSIEVQMKLTLKYVWDSGIVYPDGSNILWLGTTNRRFGTGVNIFVARWYAITFGHGLDIERSGHHIRDDITREVITITLSKKEYAMMCLRFANES